MKRPSPLPRKATVAQLAGSVWLFPALVCLTLLLLTAFRLSGTSVGHYYQLLVSDNSHDSALIAGEPRKIRSDEWGVNTPLTLSQIGQHFPVVNQTTGQGQDMSMTFDVPYKDWSTIFRPQNWSFFIMPAEYAFAFKWWFVAATLALACYVFVLVLLPGRYLLASLLSLCLVTSPFLHWWYQSGVFLSLAYALLICTLLLRLTRSRPMSRRQLVVHLLGLAYVLTAFAFILYAPFLVPIVLVAIAFLAGELADQIMRPARRAALLRRLAWLAIPLAACAILTFVFLGQHSQVLNALSASIYPGQRTEPSGGYSLLQLLGGYYNSSLQNDNQAIHYNYNQSEASNFILLFPFLIPFFAYLFVQRKQRKLAIDWTAIFLLAVAVIFSVRLFAPASEVIFNLLQINRIPHNRILIGFGFLNFLLVLVATRRLLTLKTALPRNLIFGSAVLTFVTVAIIGASLRANFPGYIVSIASIAVTAVTIATIIYLLLSKRIVAALGLLGVFSLLSVYHINPLYQGLGFLTNSRLSSSIRNLHDPNAKWVVGDYAAAFESLPAANSAPSLSGVYAYPQNAIWDDIGADPQTKAVYNRYAHVFFSVGDLQQPAQSHGAYFDPPALDAFRVHADACSEFLAQQKVRYVMLTETSSNRCLHLVRTIAYPKITFYIYEIRR